MQFTIGCDPEVFLADRAGRFISSVGLIGGSKNFPRPIGEGCAVQEDNVSVEFNTPPCADVASFINSIKYNLSWIRERAAKLNLDVKIVPSAVFDDEQLNTEAAQTFGCEPDFNAWEGGRMNPRPRAKNRNLRSAGGHVHVSVPEGMNGHEVIKAMDWFIGCQMLEFDDDAGRRELYGKAGAFRKKSYGVEYRTASNKWIEDDEKIAWVYRQTDKALEWVAAGNRFTEAQGQMIQDCINNSDINLLRALSEELPL